MNAFDQELWGVRKVTPELPLVVNHGLIAIVHFPISRNSFSQLPLEEENGYVSRAAEP